MKIDPSKMDDMKEKLTELIAKNEENQKLLNQFNKEVFYQKFSKILFLQSSKFKRVNFISKKQ